MYDVNNEHMFWELLETYYVLIVFQVSLNFDPRKEILKQKKAWGNESNEKETTVAAVCRCYSK